MVKIWCSISSHGYGHAAQLIPILNELGRAVSDLEVILRTTVPQSFFEHKLQIKWDLQEAQQDIGCLQQGPLEIDVEGTWNAHRQFHQNWDEEVRKEAEAIKASRADLVIANISHLGIAAGSQAGCSTVAVASLSWDQILFNLGSNRMAWQEKVLLEIQEAYAQASHLIRLYPGIDMPAFHSSTMIGPSSLTFPTNIVDIRSVLPVRSTDRIVVVAFGGIPFEYLPIERLEYLEGFHFILSGVQVPLSFARISSWEGLGIPFLDVFRQADIVMTKPGYSTMVTAIKYQIPLVYVCRENFIEEGNLAAYARKYGRACELSRKDFDAGEWGEALNKVLQMPHPHLVPPPDGAREAVDILKSFLRK